ncbi:uncharacterized protein LOC111251112 isoform X2 [Varroa destructor]|uniref:Uncharacterized protein n=1 Tax=Varroa destructor TaxID=109461 RepID=A0A7M7K8A8_VARDE|nr:uncharacterized protein LOC111251112 isoform X2 [Varroa destructor]
MCWIITGCSVVWRKPAILHGLAVTHGRAAFANRILRVVFATAYAFSLLAGSDDFLKNDEGKRLSTCVRLFVFVHKMHAVYVAPAISLVEACMRPPPPAALSSRIAFPKSHTTFKITLLLSALTSLAFEEIAGREQLALRICRLYLRFSSYTIMELYLEKSRVLLVSLAKLDQKVNGDFDDIPVTRVATSAESWSTVGSGRYTTAYRCWRLIEMKARVRDSTRWLNRSFGAQLLVFYASTAVNLSCLAGELIIVAHRTPDALWSVAPRLIECMAAMSLAVFIAQLGSGIISLCLGTQFRIRAENRLADEIRQVLAFRQEWDALRIIDSATHELPTLAGAVVNIVTLVAIVLQFDVTVTESVFGNDNGEQCKDVNRNCSPMKDNPAD